MQTNWILDDCRVISFVDENGDGVFPAGWDLLVPPTGLEDLGDD